MSTLTTEAPASLPSYASARHAQTQEIRLHRPFTAEDRQLFTLTQRYFVVGGQQLVLDEPPQIAVYPGIFEFEIVGWNIRLAYGRQREIGRELIRKFLTLHAKAEKSVLTEQDEAEWAEISKRVDYRKFSVERSPARYVEGTLSSRNDSQCQIEWHDGTKEWIIGKWVAAFALLEPGERFTALAKFGEGNRLCEISNVSPVVISVSGEDGEQMWREWPANR
jgi:hypothetical protein